MPAWYDYSKTGAYKGTAPTSNYGQGHYISRVFTALALDGRTVAGSAELGDSLGARSGFREASVLSTIVSPTDSNFGGWWAEGANYGPLAVENLLLAGLAYEQAGLGTAAAERAWAGQVVRALVHARPASFPYRSNTLGETRQGYVYPVGDGYHYPMPFPGAELFKVLTAAAGDENAKGYANLEVHRSAHRGEAGWIDLGLYDPAAPVLDWTAVEPTQYFAQGQGVVFARADWSYVSTWIAFQLGNTVVADHQGFCPGNLLIYRGADDLLFDANNYTGNQGYPTSVCKSTYANLVVLDDGGDGVQVYRNSMGVWYGPLHNTAGCSIDRYEDGRNFVYVSGDYTEAYSSNHSPGNGGSASELRRSVFYVRPDYVVVHDRVATKKSQYTKHLRWHAHDAPAVDGNSWVIGRGKSRLFGATYASVPLVTTWSLVTALKPNFYQIVTRNAEPVSRVRYVTALQTAPASTPGMVATSRVSSSGGGLEGVLMGDVIVLFGDAKGLADPETYAFTHAGPLTHYIAGLPPNRRYTLSGAVSGQVTTSSAGVLAFKSTGDGPQTVSLR